MPLSPGLHRIVLSSPKVLSLRGLLSNPTSLADLDPSIWFAFAIMAILAVIVISRASTNAPSRNWTTQRPAPQRPIVWWLSPRVTRNK